jgi:mannose-6-phosphate isomerase
LKGLKQGVSKDWFRRAIGDGSVESLIRSIPVKEGHCHYLPSGTVHALGAGILAAEVQTPSDTTFRVYDFKRVDPSTGKERKLHVEQAVECIDFSGTPEEGQRRSHVGSYFTTVTRLVTSPYFILEKVRMTEGIEEPVPYDQPVVWMMLEGEVELRVGDVKDVVKARRGETVLLPAGMKNPTVKTVGDCVWLEVTFPVKPELG